MLGGKTIMAILVKDNVGQLSNLIKQKIRKNLKDGVFTLRYDEFIIRVAYIENQYLSIGCSDIDLQQELISLGDEIVQDPELKVEYLYNGDVEVILHTTEWVMDLERKEEVLNDKNKYINLHLLHGMIYKSKVKKKATLY